MKLGLKIRQLRTSQFMTQENLAFKSGLHQSYISELENGHINPQITTLERIANALTVKITELLEEKELSCQIIKEPQSMRIK